MPDYYPALARTVLRLPNNNAAARRELYELARSKIVEILRRRDLKVSESEIARERAALEAAIGRVEDEFKSVQARTSRGPAPNRPMTAVVDGADVDNVEVRDGRLGGEEAKSRRARARSEKINARAERDADPNPASARRPADIRSRKTIKPRFVDDHGAIMDRWRDLIEMYAAQLGDDITGPILIGVGFAIGMMVFTGLMYATIMLTIRFVL